MDDGLEGTVITRNYAALGYLAEHSWWKHTWHFCHLFERELIFGSDCLPRKQCGDNCAIMELFLNSGLWLKQQLIILNRMRRFKKIHQFSESLCKEGKIINQTMLTSCEGHSSGEFSIERPRLSDIALWCTALKSLTSVTYTLPSPLGPFLQMPSTITSWKISADHTRLYRLLPNGSADVYVPHGRTTRRQKFSRQRNIPPLSIPPHLKLLTVFPDQRDNILSFHSSAFRPIKFPPPLSSVVDILRSWKNPRL